MGGLRILLTVAVLVFALVPDVALGAVGQLACTQNPSQKVSFYCEGTGTVAVGANLTYTVTVDETGATNQLYDLNITLKSANGDSDLFVVSPGLNITASERTVGPDVVYVYRSELQEGDYTIVVLGILPETAFGITVEAYETELELNPTELLAVGQAMMECCNVNKMACPDLKAANPGVYLGDGSTDYPDDGYPNFCYYHGNLCTKDRHLLELSMPAQAMTCAFPLTSLLKLPKLRRIDFTGNFITGNLTTMAPAMANLTGLKYISLSQNSLVGRLDKACGLAKSGVLAQLALDSNQLSGSVPSCILNAPALVELRAGSNSLNGTLPAVNSSSNLVTLLLDDQMGAGLTGGIPALNKLKQLIYIDLGSNSLSGPLPTPPTQLWDVDFADNQLTGTLPASYGMVAGLRSLGLEGNQLAGTLPAGLAKLAALRELDVSSNMLTGTLPTDWDSARSLILLYLNNNQLTGTIPGSMADMEALVVLTTSNNQLSGDLGDYAFASSEERNDLNSALRMLDFSDNSLTGDLHSFTGMRDLGVFSAAHASTAETVLAVQAAVPRTLDLGGNNFAGLFPNWLIDGLISSPENVAVNLTGSILTCPIGGFQLAATPPAGRLSGLYCYAATSAAAVELGVTSQSSVESQVVVPKAHVSTGAALGIFVCVVLIIGAIVGVGYMLWQRRVRTQGQAYSGRFQSFADVAPPNAPNKFNYNTWDTQIEMSGNSYGARSQGIKSAASTTHSTREGR